MISNLAYVHPEAKIGENVTIEPFAAVYKDVIIGDGSWIGPQAVLMEGARIGKNCRIFPGAVVGAIPQDLKFMGEYTTVEIGDNVTLRECVTVNRGTKSKGKTVIGNNCLLMAYSHVAHDCLLHSNIIIGNGTQLAGEIEIGDYAILSAHVLAHQFTRIGEHVMISGGSHILKDVPPFVKAAREPLGYVGINVVGLRRRSFSADKVQEIQTMYRHLYLSNMNRKDAVRHIEETMPQTPERDLVVNFVKESKRGIMKGYTSEGEED